MPRVYYSLFDRLMTAKMLEEAFRKVKKANGAHGIDGQTIADYAAKLESETSCLLWELKEKTYRSQAVRCKEINKPGGGIRFLDIPTVRDRVVQQALNDILVPIFDPHFHPSSYGYRTNRSAHDTIAKATAFMRRYGLCHVVDMELSKCPEIKLPFIICPFIVFRQIIQLANGFILAFYLYSFNSLFLN